VTDEELTALALAADPDAPIPPDAVSFYDLDAPAPGGVLPDWYMPAPAGAAVRPGWRRRVGLLLVGSFLAINAAGLCSTYGHVVLA
jgi:hypothetical protein